MSRKHDPRMDELEGVAQRLRDERPQASPLELDRIKTTAMARAKAGTRRGTVGARRLAVAGLTVGLLAAGTGGVLAGQSGKHGTGAAIAQYGNNCDVANGNGNKIGNGNGNNSGNENGNGNNNYNCNENSFNTENTTITNNTTNNVTNNYNSSTVTISAPANTGVLGASTTKPVTTSKLVKIHLSIPHRSKLRRVTLRVNGKIVSVLKGKKAKANISIAKLPCSATVTVTAVTTLGKKITQTHVYHLC